MSIIESPKVRKTVYVITGIVAIIATYLGATGVFGGQEMALVTSLNVFVAGLAGLNVNEE